MIRDVSCDALFEEWCWELVGGLEREFGLGTLSMGTARELSR